MSYFKPLNSNENNLHIIRAGIDTNGDIVKPSVSQLPSGFTRTIVSSGVVKFDYPNVYISSDIPSVFVQSDTSGKTVQVTEKNQSNCTVTSSDPTFPNFDICIVGSKSSGPVFSVSNRGWKYANDLLSKDLIYSDMLVGINNDLPKFNLDINGTYGFTPNKIDNTSLTYSNIIQHTYNVLNIKTSNSLNMNAPTNDGQLLYLLIGSTQSSSSNVTIDISANITTALSTNVVLQNVGDSVSFYSLNNKWLIYNYNFSAINKKKITYNNLAASSYSFDVVTNGYLTVMNVDQNLTIDPPVSIGYDGYVIDLVVSSVTNDSNINFVLSNITSSKNSITLSNISDHVKLLCNGNKWLVIN